MKPIDAYGTNGKGRRHSRCLACRAYDDGQRYQDPERRLYVVTWHANKRARRLGISGRLSGNVIERKLKRQNHRCYWCDRELDDDYQIDHIKPLGHGYYDGDNSPENIAISCSSCNRDKADKPLNQWLGILASRGIVHAMYTGKHYQQPLFEKET